MHTNPHAYIIAEAGVNHNGNLDMAMQLVNVAADAGANAVKFQTFKAEKLVSMAAQKADYQKKLTESSESQLEMLRKLELDDEKHRTLIEHCYQKNIQFLSTPFDLESLDFLVDKCNLSRLKLPSGEITNAPLLLKAAQSSKPIILSTGMSTLGEIETALGVLAFGYTHSDNNIIPSIKAFEQAFCSEEGQAALAEKVVLLHCTTEYPVTINEVNLRVLETMRNAFNLPVGYSDHTLGITIPIAAIALGAVVIEKHFTLDRSLSGPDHKASLEPDELKLMVQSIRQVEEALGSSRKVPTLSEYKNKPIARKSLVTTQKIKKGEPFTLKNLTAKRPGEGISPLYFWEWLGRLADRDYKQDEMVGI
ncbi:MAG: N-acetylneuraminate synthase [Desulfosporosinus sp. BRH_c37]|nr:MAG: N-acetylneuraminate synthase [Desulfosporosinus sp. BRH_c37]